VLQRVAVVCRGLLGRVVHVDTLKDAGLLQCVAACCSVLHRFAVCCSVLQCVAVCFSVHVEVTVKNAGVFFH